ncbi:MAG: SusC/RagA family TonB-linked outer membrane protein [Salinibacter sp.]|uniref:SusC/RagA family TonB-linked outer membrane protein n=1 Tax=Salinibacter sp. TaxID=2065818 RepID=UPI0035D440DF
MTQPLRTSVVFLFALLFPLSALGQGTVEGTVIDGKADTPLPGAQVVVVGTNIGTATATDGSFRITGVPTGEQVIRAQFVGYGANEKTVTIEDGETLSLNFVLRESAINLQEVVVTGAGAQSEKRQLGNSIASIDAAEVNLAPVQNFSDLIQGRTPGVVGLPSGGLTGEGARIRIRGSASLSQSNEPIVYVDGVRVNNGGGFSGFADTGGGGVPSRLDDLNPNSIASVEVLKGASAATLYGTQASNGVLQITTKRGQQGDLRFTFSSEASYSRYPDVYPDQVGFARSTGQANSMEQVIRGKQFEQGNPNNIRPYELVSQNVARELTNGVGIGQTYSASVSGGSEGIKFYVSGRYQSDESPFESEFIRNPDYPAGVSPLSKNNIRRVQGMANLTITPSDQFQMLVSTGYTDTQFSSIQTNNNIYGTISLAQFSKPEQVVPGVNRSGTIAFATVNESLMQEVNQDVQHFFGSADLTYSPMDELNLDATFGVDYTSALNTERRPYGWNIDGFSSDTPDGFKDVGVQDRLFITADLKTNYSTELGQNFTSELDVGAQGFFEYNTVESSSGSDFPGPGFQVVDAGANVSVSETISEIVNAGVFAQEQLGYKDYAFFTVGARYDANSAFGSDFSGVLYPKAQISIVPTDAAFFGQSSLLSSLRLRAAIGQSGLQPGAFDAQTTFTSLSSGTGAGVVPDNLGNPDLEPEVATEWETGFDAGFFNDRVSLTFTYWNRTVDQALVSRQFPPTGGFRNPQLVNIGKVDAQGVEVKVDGTVFESESFSVDAFANTAYLHQKVTDLGGAPPIKVGGSYPRYRNYIVEGYSPGAHFGVQLKDTPDGTLPVDLNGDGSADTEQELVNYLGGLTVSDLRGFFGAALPQSPATVMIAQNPDSPTGNSKDHYLGKPTPDFQGSFGFDATLFDNWTLSTLFEYKAGNFYVNNLTDAFRQANPIIGRNLPKSSRVERNYLTGGIDENGNPQNSGEVRLKALKTWLNDLLALAPFSGLNTVEKADFIRLRELSLTYRVPSRWVQQFGARQLSLTAAGRNLLLFTKYDGVDPELNAVGRGAGTQLDQNFLTGVEAFGFPLQRQYSFKLRLRF